MSYHSYRNSDFLSLMRKCESIFYVIRHCHSRIWSSATGGITQCEGKTGAYNMLGNTDGKQPASSQWFLYNLITCPHLFLPWVIYLVVISPVCSCTVRLWMKSWLISPLGRVLCVRLTSYYKVKGHFAGIYCQQYVYYCFRIYSNYTDKREHVCTCMYACMHVNV